MISPSALLITLASTTLAYGLAVVAAPPNDGFSAPLGLDDPTDWEQEFERLEDVHFSSGSSEAERAEGIRRLQSITTHEAFLPMIKRFHDDQEDVRLAMIDHFATQGAHGQAALAWTSIHSKDASLRYESGLRLTKPAGQLVLELLDRCLRHSNQNIASHAAHLVNLLDVTEAIPLLINSQITAVDGNQSSSLGSGGLIRSGQQISYVAGLRPVFGPGVAAYQPIVGTINEGFAVDSGSGRKLVCRPGINRALIALTSRDIGSSTESFGYDVEQWHSWHRSTYLPFKEEQRRKAERVESIKRRAEQIERSRLKNESKP